MNTLKVLSSLFLGLLFVLFVTSKTLAGGGLVMLDATPNIPGIRLHPGEFYTVRATVYADTTYTTKCQNCPITFKFQNGQSTDVITPNTSSTDANGQASAKMISNILGDRLVYVDVQLPDGNMTMSSFYVLGYNQSETTSTPTPISYSAPEMVYPQNGQTLDLEGAYMFKVNPVNGAAGYLYGFFQNGTMVYENYRDDGSLSGTEFAVWESNRFHTKFKSGEVKVMVRALVNNQWTDAREITINLKSRNSNAQPVPTAKPIPTTTKVEPKVPTLQPSQTIVVVQDSSASAELQQKVEDLEQKLEESQKKQSELEKRLEGLLNWIKSTFPFFKN